MVKFKKVKVEGDVYSAEDMADFYVQTRGFPSILKIGKHMGEGQSGGRAISQIAHQVENKLVAQAKSQTDFQSSMDKVVKKIEQKRKKKGLSIGGDLY